MCGIFGFSGNNVELAKKLCKLLHHRGPDQKGIEEFDDFILGFTRLAIQDLSLAGNQPMFNKEKTFCIVFNGEIYNFNEIKKDLIKKGYEFKSKTDTEVVLYSYIEYGEKCLNKFNGQFAICVFDIKNNKLFLARDRLGIKPLYYVNNDSKFMFASEIKAILEAKIIEKKLDYSQLNHYFHFGYTDHRNTIFEKINKFPPGHCGIYDMKNNELRIKKYWDLKNSKKSKIKEKEAQKILIKQLKKSVDYRLISDKPVGAFLSGGLDSSLIVALMSKRIKNLHTFSVTFKEIKSFDESRYAKIVSKKFGTKHHEIPFNSKDLLKLINKIFSFYDEPMADATLIPAYLVSQIAKKHVDVCLSGTGADELFFGYKRYQHYKLLSKYQKMPKLLKAPVKHILKAGKNKSRKLTKLSSLIEEDSKYEMYAKLFTVTYSPGLKNKQNNYFKFNNDHDPIYYDLKEYLPNDLLYKEDIATMASSLEGRFPFLDHKLVEFSFGLPSRIKLRNGKTKYLLKKVAESFLPKEIIYRKKQSFGVPLGEYFRKDLKDYMYNQIKEFNKLKILDEKTVIDLWEKHLNKEEDYSETFFKILAFNIWHNKWMM